MSISDKTPQRAIIHFCYKLGKSPLDTVCMINETYGETKVNRRLVYRWFQRFNDGDESLEDKERPGRPVDARSDHNVKLVSDAVNEDRRSTIRALCEDLDMSFGTVQRILHEDLKMRRVSARWVPRLLKDEEMATRVKESQRFLRRWKKEGYDFLRRIITADETWVYFFDPESKMQSSQWKNIDSPPPKKARTCRTVGKHMFIVFFDMEGVVLCHAVPKGQTVNAKYYSKVSAFILKKHHFLFLNMTNSF